MDASGRRWMGVAALCATFAAAPVLAAAQPTDPPTYSRYPPSPPSREGPSDSEWRPPKHHDESSAAAGIAIGLGLLCRTACGERGKPHPQGEPTRQDLLENGPHVAEIRPYGHFAVYGFVRNYWPVVIDYDSNPDSVTWLTVTVGGREWVRRLESGRQFVKFTYEGGQAPESAGALFVVHSETRSASGPGRPLPVDVTGFGCGPRAVGSVAINNLRFAASGRQLGGDFARFGYRTTSAFNKVRMEILRYSLDTRGDRPLITVSTVAQYGAGPLAPGDFGPRMWDGRDLKSHRPSRGTHRLQVRGWELDGDESWVSAISPDDVQGP